MKTCIDCKKNKEETEFKFRKDTKKHRNSCNDCQKKFKLKFYHDNKEKYAPAYAERSRKTKLWFYSVIREAKDKPCMDCSVKYPYYVMDFDHRDRNDKLFNISQWSRHGLSRQLLLNEINKCDVVCSNCHRERTNKETLNNEVFGNINT